MYCFKAPILASILDGKTLAGRNHAESDFSRARASSSEEISSTKSSSVGGGGKSKERSLSISRKWGFEVTASICSFSSG